MNWSHKSLEGPPPEYSVNKDRVLKGSTILAWLKPERLGYKVVTPNGRLIGRVLSPAEAMLMTIRDHEGYWAP